MKIMLIVLTIFVMCLICYIFVEKMEMKRLRKELDFIMSNDTNRLLHTEFNSKELKEFVSVINMYLSEIQRRKMEIEHKNKNLMVMMRNISHDLRTPLTSAAGYTDMLINSDMTDDEKMHELKIVEARLKRLTELVDSFFEFSKILTMNKKIEKDNVNLISILEECIGNFYEDYNKENREVDFRASNSKIMIYTNRAMIIRIFENLISNALKYGTGNLVVEVAPDSGNMSETKNNSLIRISFQNRIIERDLDISRIFDDFYTTDISRTKGSTGLGLAIAKEFTEQLGGKIDAHVIDNNLIIDIVFIISCVS